MLLKDTKKPFVPAPEGLHQAVCVDFLDLGEMETPWGKKAKCEIRWQIDHATEAGERFLITNRYTASLNEKATLRHHLEAWRGRKFTEKELQGFDSENLIGVNCQLQVIHVPSKKDPAVKFANIQAIVPIGKNTSKIEPENYVRVRDRVGQDAADAPPSADAEEEVPF
jgi:hypothetical protein